MSDKFAWEPTPDYVENANVTRFMRAHGIDTIDEMRRRSVEDMEWFWDAVVKDLGIDFTTPYEQVLDNSNGDPVVDVVHRRAREPHLQLRRPLGARRRSPSAPR